MIPNVSVYVYICMCSVCVVCTHGREAAVIASGCTPLYVSDPGLMKLKAWQLWVASAEPQSDGHLILLPCPRGGPHTSEDPACCLHSDSVPLCSHAAEGHATYAVIAIWKVCLTATATSHATLDWWYNWLSLTKYVANETASFISLFI